MHAQEWVKTEGRFRRAIGASELRKILSRRKGQCTWCGEPVPKGRHTWCGDQCVKEFKSVQPDLLATKVKRRDKVCQLCDKPGDEIDHIIPVCEGGGLCGPENLRLLCTQCHKEQTKLLMERRRNGKSDTR